MNGNSIEQIIIRHLTGSKANQIEHIALAGVTEITIGRDPASKIAFDSKSDDVVSRRHAIIRVMGGNQISFRLTDIGSNNGTFLNGKQITEPVELLPEDVIELGQGGVKFVFDVQPRPPYLVARTRVIDIGDANVTRVIKSAEIANAAAAQDVAPKSPSGAEPAPASYEPPPPKADISRDTVLRLLGEERRERGKAHEAASRVWMYSLSGLALLVALGGGAFYWKHAHDRNLARAELQRAKDELVKREDLKLQQQQALHEKEVADLRQRQEDEDKKAREEQKKFTEERGLNAQQIADKFGNATAQINMAWRLYDQTTGRPVFHQVMTDFVSIDKGKKEKKTLPAYVLLPNGKTAVRWLTLEDELRSNIPIGERAQGTGFAVSENGFMLTNKHVAAAWNLRFGPDDPAFKDYKYGLLYKYYLSGSAKKRGNKAKRPVAELVGVIDLQNDERYEDLFDWVPANGGIIFSPNIPIAIGDEGNIPVASQSGNIGNRTFFGRNDKLDVQFANSRGLSNASLVNFSNYSDAALIKVDTPQQLKKLNIATDDTVTVGEPVIAIGFPGVATPVKAVGFTIENFQKRDIVDIVPQPFVSEGIVAVISPAVKTENGVTFGGAQGDLIQMSINSTGSGNSGGPVFNKSGVVIGLFTYGRQRGGAQTTMAIPIKYGRDLLMSQHP